MSEKLEINEKAESNIDEDNDILLSGSKKWTTLEKGAVYTVMEGSVCVYVMYIRGDKVSNRILIGEFTKGSVIPGFYLFKNASQTSWTFQLISATTGMDALIKKSFPKEDELDSCKITLLKTYLNIENAKASDYDLEIIRFFNKSIEAEKKIIGGMEKDRTRALNENRNLIASVFSRKKLIRYERETDSELYNMMSVFCNYMNVSICSYRTLEDIYGNDFSVNDIARFSHFVTRKITLPKKWYKKDGMPFLGFYKEDGRPVLCIPGGTRYTLYDADAGYGIILNEDMAERIEDEGYIIYQHLPSKSLKLLDVCKFGFKRIKTSDIVTFLIMYVVTMLVGLLLPILNEQLFDKLIPVAEFTPILQLGEVILACMIANVFFGLVQNLASFRAVKSMEYEIVTATYGRIFRLPQRFIDEFGTTELVNRVSSISQVFTTAVTSGVTAAVGFLLSVFYIWKMFDKSKTLAWRGIIMSGILAIVMFAFGRVRIAKERERLENNAAATGKLYNFLSGILKVKVSGIENRTLLEFQKSNVASVKYDVRSRNISNVGSVVTSIMNMVFTGFIYYTVIKKKQNLTVGEYTAFNSAYGVFVSSINQLVNFFLTNATLVPTMDRIRPIFEQECEISDHAISLGKLRGQLSVNHLTFTYKDDENPVLKDISMDIKPGEFIGIVGASGCGKSTLLKCLLGFEQGQKGDVFYDNKPISSFDKVELRRQMGVVLQDGQLIVGNIYMNVTMANPDMEPSDAMELLKVVDLYDDVSKMPMGIFTAISEGGGTVSGGQRQRILLARALANNPSILLLDEATSALDNVTQQMVCNNLKEKNITRVMIAHRLSTVVDCDRIYVMDKGSIVEEGSFKELMEKKGLFYELARRQQIE